MPSSCKEAARGTASHENDDAGGSREECKITTMTWSNEDSMRVLKTQFSNGKECHGKSAMAHAMQWHAEDGFERHGK